MKNVILNIYLKELAGYKKSILFWSLGIIFFLISGMSKYQGYAKSNVSINELFKSMPSALGAIFGLATIDLTTTGGFFSIMALYLAILLSVQAVLLGSGIIAKEEIDKTAEFLFTKPISRNQAFTAKTLSAFTVMTSLSVITTISSLLIVNAFTNGPLINKDVLLLMPGIFFVQLIFLTIGISFATVMRKPKRASQFSAALLLATFITSSLVDVSDKYDYLKYLTPFKYFDPKKTFTDGGYNTVYTVIAIIFVLSFLAISQFAFKKRDFDI